MGSLNGRNLVSSENAGTAANQQGLTNCGLIIGRPLLTQTVEMLSKLTTLCSPRQSYRQTNEWCGRQSAKSASRA